jgi:hypothetical protein
MQPYAIAMKDSSPFGLAGVGELAQSKHGRVGTHLRHHHRAVE